MSEEMDVEECEFIAHVRKDGERQSLQEHLQGVAKRSGGSADKLGLSLAGEILGLLHDLGVTVEGSAQLAGRCRSALSLLDA